MSAISTIMLLTGPIMSPIEGEGIIMFVDADSVGIGVDVRLYCVQDTS